MKNLLIQKLDTLDKFKELIEETKMNKTPINISGLAFVGKAYISSAILAQIKKPICIVTYNELQAKSLVKDLSYFTAGVEYFGKREIASYDFITESKDLPYARIDVLNKIYNNQANIIVTTID